MSKIEQLIQELCPGGVVKLPLEELCEFRNGYTPSKANKEFWEDGDIPWFRMEDIREGGRILSDSKQHITQKAIKGAGLFKANSIILATTATIGEHAMIIADSLANQRFTNLSIRKSLSLKVEPKYLFYYMFLVDEWCKNHVNVSGFASVDMAGLKKLEIPLPPLPIQQEIVRILDTFTEAQANLEQELELRKKQYEYYRNQLLTFDENDPSVKWANLGDCCSIKGRIGFRGYTRNDLVKEGDGAISLSPGNIENQHISFSQCTYISWMKYDESPEIMVYENDIVLCKTGSTVGKVAIIDYLPCKTTINPQLVLLKEISDSIISKYLYYILTHDSIQKVIIAQAGIGSVPNISQAKIAELHIPVLPIARQQEIVSILDKFESAIQTLEEELALRKKQYEYYREKLLTFKSN